jgi:hypothetical protein
MLGESFLVGPLYHHSGEGVSKNLERDHLLLAPSQTDKGRVSVELGLTQPRKVSFSKILSSPLSDLFRANLLIQRKK